MRSLPLALLVTAPLLLGACGNADDEAGPGGTRDASVDGGAARADASGGGDATVAAGDTGAPPASGDWLTVRGNRIVLPSGAPFRGRGANLHDTRSCDACTYLPPDVPGLERWADELVDGWHANFIRLLLEAHADDGGFRKQWKSLGADPAYLADIKSIVDHIAAKAGVYVMVTLFLDPSIKGQSGDADSEWPTDASMPLYASLAETFADQPRVLFGLTNEPHGPASQNDALAARYQKAIDTIRTVEATHGAHTHIVVAQAPQGYARDVSYFVTKPLAGQNLAYEIHPYSPKAGFDALIVQPGRTLPLVIGEYAPASVGGTTAMTEDDVRAMWTVAKANEVPHLAWNFHMRCPPNMLADTAKDSCGLSASTGYAFPRTPWGDMVHDYLATPW
jgi:hypothetical protein